MTETTGSVATAGRGRVAEVIALRGGKAAAEAPFVIEHREALIYMLYEAAELEHGIMCQYAVSRFAAREPAKESTAAPEAVIDRKEQMGDQVTYEQKIRPLFRDRDIQSMSFAFDLSSYDDVRANAEAIYQKLADGSMPCDGSWPADDVERFRTWIDNGSPP